MAWRLYSSKLNCTGHFSVACGADPPILDIWRYNNISHIQDYFLKLFPKPHPQTCNWTAKGHRLIIANHLDQSIYLARKAGGRLCNGICQPVDRDQNCWAKVILLSLSSKLVLVFIQNILCKVPLEMLLGLMIILTSLKLTSCTGTYPRSSLILAMHSKSCTNTQI